MSLVTVAWAAAAVNVFDVFLCLLILHRLVKLPFGPYFGSFRWTCLNAIAAGGAMLGVRALLEPRFGEQAGVLAAAATTGIATYLALAFAYERPYVMQMISILRPVRVAGARTA